MESPFLSGLFPAENFSLIAVILGMPLLGAFVNGVWGKQLGKAAVRLMALAAVGTSFAASLVSFLALHRLVQAEKGEHVKLAWTVREGMHTNGGNSRRPVPTHLKV